MQLQCAPLGLALAENWQTTGRQLADNWQTSSFTTFNCLLRFNRRDLDKARLLEQLWLLILFVSGIELCKFEGSFPGILLHLTCIFCRVAYVVVEVNVSYPPASDNCEAVDIFT